VFTISGTVPLPYGNFIPHSLMVPYFALADGYSAAANIFSSSAADRIGTPSIDFDGCPSTRTSGLPTSVTR
jgi:hypothetical protein